MENPAISDLREMEVLRFLFELKREQIDPAKLQQMLIDHQIQSQVKQLAQLSEARSNSPLSLPTLPPHMSRVHTSSASSVNSQSSRLSTPERTPYCLIPEPKIVFQYVPNPKFPTPTPTPEPAECTESTAPIDYSKTTKTRTDFEITDRCQFIKLKEDTKEVSPPTPTTSGGDSDSEQENCNSNSKFKNLVPASVIENWCGSSIYNNLPELVMTEYDKILRESHSLKVEVIKTLNIEFPVSYDYNPKKSRIRTNYADPQIADDRTRNNIASRRSRQRKKFQTQMIQYSVDYDKDENFLLSKQEKWLRGIIANLEQKALTNDDGHGKIKKLRKQCGFE